MNRMIEQQSGAMTVTESYLKAETLHRKILINGQIAADALVEFAKSLKEMRDTKLYTELGYDCFEAYCEEAAHIKKRQAYNFIKALEEFGQEELQSNASLGITKLAALATLCYEDREQLMSAVDVEALSTRELEEKVAELKKKCEQLTMELDSTRGEAELGRKKQAEDADKESRKLEDRIASLEEENNRLKNRPIDVAVAEPDEKQLAKIRKDIEDEVRAESCKKIEKALKDQQAAEKKSQELEKQIAVLQSTAKKSTPPPSEKKELLKYHFNAIQSAFNAAAEIIGALEGEEKGKFKSAMLKLVDECGKAIKRVV